MRRPASEWDSGRIWSGVYAIRAIVVVAFALGSWAIGARWPSVFVAGVVLPVTAVVAKRHLTVGHPGWMLPADQYLAALALLIDPRVAVPVAVCQIVGAVNDSVACERLTVDRSIATGGLLNLVAALVHRNLALAVYFPFVTLSAFVIGRFVGYIQLRATAANSRFEELLDGINAIVIETDVKTGRLLYMNRNARQLLGGTQRDDNDLVRCVHPEDRQRVVGRIMRARERGAPTTFEVRVRRRDGEYVYMEQRITFSDLAASRRQRNVLVDITGRKSIERELQHLATHDSLTDLPNRRLFHDRLERAIDRARRQHQSLAVVVIDLNGFKSVNDTLGHEAGDALLKEVARRLATSLRSIDTVARLGGDEFALLLENTDEATAIAAAQRCSEAVRAPMDLAGVTVNPNASFGIAVSADGDGVDTLLRHADAAMYSVKRKGGGVQGFQADGQVARGSRKASLIS